METMAERLRRARIEAGYETAQDAADGFGWNASAYRHHENGTRGFDIEAAKRYGRAFKVNPGWLLALDTIKPAQSVSEEEEIPLLGKVAAGLWREETPNHELGKVKVGPNPIPGVERFAVEVEGQSMDRTLPDHSTLECLRVPMAVPRDGDLVIVERANHNLTELTCKRLHIERDQWVLRAESTLTKFDGDIVIGKPDEDYHLDPETRVIGIVVRAYQTHFRRA